LLLVFAASCAGSGACLRVPPPDASPPAPRAREALPDIGAEVVVLGVGPADIADARPYLGKACQVVSMERSAEAKGFARAMLTCGDEQILFSEVKLRLITKRAMARRLPRGIDVTIAGLAPGDVYYDARERFIGNRCTVVNARRSRDWYYQGRLQCSGVAYQFAYVALSAAP